MSARPWALVALLLLGGLSACVGYIRTRVDEPVAMSVLEQLRIGHDELGRCLAALGAPNHVFEYEGDGVALLWTWQDSDDWSIDVSVPVTETFNASFELDLTFLERPGCMLLFGPDLVLAGWRAGLIGDLLPGRQRPVVVE